ncbi:GUN4 domain-containing protein [Leptolyngbya sp. NIES-2104]|uniref:GUN4 domain-containing protein n=1 Tax=Leptolyngbya sp. NIES-2104 TaxID=1552121 RepID=UPI00178CE7FA|nr:GUN4 domain-containing protein [Leptolyngbya sp. NIES-2104]
MLFAFFAAVCIFTNNNLLCGICLLISTCLYFAWQKNIQGKLQDDSEILRDDDNEYTSQQEIPNTSDDCPQRNINIENGNYNEHIAGDYITVQGNLISVNQDFPDFVDSLAAVVARLSAEQDKFAELREGIVDDLENSARRNPVFKKKLSRWKPNLGKSSKASDAEVATALMNKVEEVRWNVVNKEVIFDSEVYENLENYLKEGDWEKADSETVEVIVKVLSAAFGSEFTTDLKKNAKEIRQGNYQDGINLKGLSADHIILLPSIHLKHIDRLWTKYSSGRFGFSVQKRLIREIYKKHEYWDNYLYWNNSYSYYGQPHRFGQRVGWQVDGHWIFITDASFTTNAPVGHLPFQLYAASSSYSHRYKYKVCLPILKVIAERLYD